MPLKDIIVGSIVLLSMSVFFLLYTFGFIHRFIWWMCERKKKRYRKVNLMDKDIAEKIYWILIEEGQHNLKFPLGSVITNTPDEVRDIVRKHIKDITHW